MGMLHEIEYFELYFKVFLLLCWANCCTLKGWYDVSVVGNKFVFYVLISSHSDHETINLNAIFLSSHLMFWGLQTKTTACQIPAEMVECALIWWLTLHASAKMDGREKLAVWVRNKIFIFSCILACRICFHVVLQEYVKSNQIKSNTIPRFVRLEERQ